MIAKHQATLDAAVQALHGRTFFAAFPENPSPEIYGADADAQGREKFAVGGLAAAWAVQPSPIKTRKNKERSVFSIE